MAFLLCRILSISAGEPEQWSPHTDYARGWTVEETSDSGAGVKRVSPMRPDWLWDPPSLLFKGAWGSTSMGVSSRCVRLTTYFHLVLMLRIRGSTPPFPPCFHGAHRDSFTFTFICLQSLCYGSSDNLIVLVIKLRDVRCGVRLPAGARHFSVVQNAQPTSWVHPTFYSKGIGGGSFPAVKAAGGSS
jgi:hypothetical protein